MRFDFKENKFVEEEATPNRSLIVGSDREMSEADVFTFHLKIKGQLIQLGIPEGHPVCIYGEKEAVFPVVMITLMSLNIPYVPIDAIMPSGRIEKIKEQTGSRVLINCSERNCEVDFEIKLNGNLEIEKNGNPKDFKLLLNGSDPIRYILFTSGSTGVPKGVQITASALNSFVEWFLTWPLINRDAVFMNQAPFSFDVSLCDLIGCFANGSRLVLNNYSTLKSGQNFLERLKKYGANTMVCTPSFIHMYLSVPEFRTSDYPLLKQIIFMGEELHAIHVKKLKKAFPDLRVVNAYGPTEATVVSTYVEITEEVLENYSKSLPIGYCRPKGDMNVLNVDKETGYGELGISGPNLSIGYLNDPEKTEAAFIHHKGQRTYKTGDLGYRKGELIFYLGRNDSQVKLNGYRIELDEISTVLLGHNNIKNAAVLPLTSGNVTKKIVCFVLLLKKIDKVALNTELKEFLLNHLPSYMIPSEFIAIDEFPLNANYKTDKKALLERYMNEET